MSQWGRTTCLVAVVLSTTLPAAASPDRIRFLEGPGALSIMSPEQQAAPVEGYLPAADRAEIASAVQPPPAPGTPAARAETELFNYLQASAGDRRWQMARDDDATVYLRFSGQIGFSPDRTKTPALVAVLNRIAEDTLAVAAEAKARHARLRPFEIQRLARVCGHDTPPVPGSTAKGTGYPSGHASVAWGTALVLVEVVPASAQAIIGRAVAYGQSRVVCGLHYPADVEAGQFIGSAVLAKAFDSPAFRNDLACARREIEALAMGQGASDLPACKLSP